MSISIFTGMTLAPDEWRNGAYIAALLPYMPRFFLAFSRILCYAVNGAAGSAPVSGSLDFFGGDLFFCPLHDRKGGQCMDVTWEGIFQFCLVIIAVINLVFQINNKKR